MASRTLTDEKLIECVARNESWALAEIYDRYARLVFSLGYKTLNESGAAEEIVQEVFTKVWRAAGDYDPARGRFSSWLIGIAHHQCVDELRRRRVRPATETIDDPNSPELADEDNLEDIAAQSFEQARVKQALAQIPPEQRQVIEAGFFSGLTHQEIASQTGQPLGTVKTRLRLGMKKLKDLLAESD